MTDENRKSKGFKIASFENFEAAQKAIKGIMDKFLMEVKFMLVEYRLK